MVVLSSAFAAAKADTVIFNKLGMTNPFNTVRGANDAPLAETTFATTTTIGALGIYDAMSGPGTQTFFIFTDAGVLLYQSAAKTFAGDGGTGFGLDSYKVSDPFSFTFLAGSSYLLGASSNVSTGYYVAFDSVTQNGITVQAANKNVSQGTALTSSACCSVGIELLAPAQTAVTPEPSSIALVGTGLLGAVGVIRRRFRLGHGLRQTAS